MRSTDGESSSQAARFRKTNLAVAAITARQFGVISRAQLNECDLSDNAILYRLRTGALRRVHRGVFALNGIVLSQAGRWMAALLACGAGAVLSHRSAAQVWGIGESPPLIDIARLSGSRGGPTGVRMHRPRSLPPTDVTRQLKFPVTTVSRTLVDLAGLKNPSLLADSFSASRRLGLLDPVGCMQCISDAPQRPGVAHLVALIERFEPLGAPSRSELQDRVLNLCLNGGIPRPESEVPLLTGHVVDFLWRAEQVILEVDGKAFHRDRYDEDRDRDLDHSALGYVTVRVTYTMIRDKPDEVVRRLREVLELRRSLMTAPISTRA